MISSFSTMSLVPMTYDLQIRPNAIAQGIPVEANEDGVVVAVAYPWGEEVRNHGRYLIIRSPRVNWFSDRNAMLHPLD